MVALLLLSGAPMGCQKTPAAHLATPPKYEPVGQSKCSVQASTMRPLVVEWPAADRASLEARMARGLVAVRAAGCEIEVLRQCTVPGSYAYLGLTRKNDQVLIDNADELYAQLPIGAARLEAKLARSGRLDVRMALVGMFEAPVEQVERDALRGDCGGATHLISGAQVGAFKFYAGGSGEIGGKVGVGQAGLGGSSTASEELLSADGEPQRCDASTTIDARPPEGCGAVLRIELVSLGAPSCPAGSRWDGQRCIVSQVHCPQGTTPLNGQCVTDAVTPPVTTPTTTPTTTTTPATAPKTTTAADPDVPLCREYCGKALRCESERTSQPLPEGNALQGLMRRCQRFCEWGASDWSRPRLRQCVAGGCDTMQPCNADAPG